MLNLVLIDGNSLLNRAFYATKHLTTKSGIPTNAVFGFTKLLLKIIGDIKPDRLIVTFDLKAPTFRHKMYEGYKATRKPMPDDLAAQLGMLKSLLQSMRIAMCEKAGYEADDLIGTLSHKFEGVKSIVITGDRDSYQLIDERTDVYLTKTGVSDLLKLNKDNFQSIIGYAPEQVIEMKALMGDSSDNIPGVAGIGEKTALSLITQFGSLDGVYSNLDSLPSAVRSKLENGKDTAYLSKELATIDRNVDLSVDLDECGIHMPFSQEVRTQFLQLEFTSLLKLDIFEPEAEVRNEIVQSAIPIKFVSDAEAFAAVFSEVREFSLVRWKNGFHIYSGGTEYVLRERETLLDDGLHSADIEHALGGLFGNPQATALLYGKKEIRKFLHTFGCEIKCAAEDISLMKYLADYTGKDDNLALTLQGYGLSEETPAYGVSRLYDILKVKLEEENLGSLYRQVELPLSDVLCDMEECGVKIDRAASAQFEKRYKEEIAQVTADIYAEAGEEFNINSPLQLGNILFEKLRLPAPKKGKRGAYSTSADILEKLADDYKIVRDVLKCRHYQKLLSTYIDGFKPLIDPKTGLVHTCFNQVQTTTGRLSSANPNLQNIPIRDDDGRELRKLFIARGADRVLIDADYSQIELRLLAHFSGCKELIEAYREGKDIHALTASQVFSVPIDQVSSSQRRAAKAVNFGIIYGISDFGLASNLNISAKQAGEYIRKYFETYSDVKKYMDSNVEFARKNGYVTTLLGRKRVINEIKSSNYNIRSFGERAAMNMPLQGSSADIIKIAMLRIFERMKKEGLRSKLILQVHDELVIDAYEDEADRVGELLRFEMENAVQLNVPLVAEVHRGKNWYEAK